MVKTTLALIAVSLSLCACEGSSSGMGSPLGTQDHGYGVPPPHMVILPTTHMHHGRHG